jgi:vacuolar-type H+-ATPase subunit I/STV1
MNDIISHMPSTTNFKPARQPRPLNKIFIPKTVEQVDKYEEQRKELEKTIKQNQEVIEKKEEVKKAIEKEEVGGDIDSIKEDKKVDKKKKK